MKVAYTTFLQSKRRSKRYAEILDEIGHAAETGIYGASSRAEEVNELDKLLAVLSENERAVLILFLKNHIVK